MTITYTINVKDVRAFGEYVRLKTPQGIRIVSTIIFILIAVQMTMTLKDKSYTARIISFLLAFGLFSLIAKLLILIYTRIAEWRTLTPEKQKGLLCEHTITLTDEWIIETTSVNEDKKKWSGVYKVVDTKEYIYIFLTPQMAHIIHKRSFSSPGQSELFFKKAFELHAKAVAA